MELRTKVRKDFEKYFLKLMNNSLFGNTMENVRKHRDIKLVTTDKIKSYLVSETVYRIAKWFSEKLLTMDMKKTKVEMNKILYMDLVIHISNIVMYDYWHN